MGGAAFLLAAVAFATPAAAQFGTTAKVARPIPSTNSLDPTAAGSQVLVKNRIVAQTTAELLKEVAGTRVVAAGAQGTPFCVRLRGAACDQVTVMLGDVPLSSPDTGAFDLSLLPLEAVGGFQVFRGGTPAWLNDGAVGGVVQLLPRSYEETEVGARVNAGSFGSWRTNAFGATASEKVEFFGTAGAAGARNDFPYLDDGGTRFDPSDDVERLRQNADFLEGFGFSNLKVETSDSSQLDMVFLGVGRDRGEPGPGSSPALNANARSTRLIGSASWLQQEDGPHPYRVQVAANYDYGRNRFTDELGEIGNGIPRQTDDQTHAIFGRVAASVTAVPWLEVTTIASTRYQAFDPDDEMVLVQEVASSRLSAAGTVEARFFGEANKVLLELRPSVRLGWSRASLHGSGPGEPELSPSSDFQPTYRLGAAIAPLEWLAFRGSVGNGYKLPSLLQLFGNRSFVAANPGLIPERSLSVDGGVTARGHRGIVSGYATVGAFVSYIDNMIRFRPNSQSQIVYENIGSGRSRGVELELRGGVTEHFFLTAELTWTQAVDLDIDKWLPGQPQWDALIQPEAHSGALSKRVSDLLLFFQIAYIGKSYSDRVNLVELPARTVLGLGAGADFFEGRLGLSFRVDDLLDVRGYDLLGYPLPGRRYSGRLSVRHSW
ncbi:MAG: TonB-dependent receptor [Polyangiales bacterium]